MDFFCLFVCVGVLTFCEDLGGLLKLTALYKGVREALLLCFTLLYVSNLKTTQCFRKELWFILMVGSYEISKRWYGGLAVRLSNPKSR